MPEAPYGLPRLLAGVSEDGRAMRFDEHAARFGPMPRIDATTLIAMAEKCGLRGRGGAAFPTATKLRGIAGSRRAVLIANGSEGEPASSKDQVLLASSPNLVLDGAQIVAAAIGATDVIVSVSRGAVRARDAVHAALSERAARGFDRARFELVDPPDRYVAGEETALVHWLNGGPAKPTFIPPRPFQRGVGGRPTLIQNVETLAHIALLARFGVDWFRSLGNAEEPGTRLVTIGGAVERPGVYEIAVGMPLGDLISSVGGRPDRIQAVLIGGYFGSWLPAAAVERLSLTERALRNAGASFGCGAIVALPIEACALREVARVVDYLAAENAGQCWPCVYGLRAVADGVMQMANGRQSPALVAKTVRWAEQVNGRGACRHPDGAVRFVRSALRVFADEVERHQRRGPCPGAPTRALLPVPRERELEWR
ncbi:MAG: NADH-ubiquinone oxidoreductase-F iron-sulfur binding region domain-containing protein [Actinomycetota bacterium]